MMTALDWKISGELNRAAKLADLLDRISAALDVLEDDRLPSIGELDAIIARLERVIELRALVALDE